MPQIPSNPLPTPSAYLVGPAGWSYADWKGRVYPAKPPRDFDSLAWIARFFATVEVNSSFYRIPSARAAESWVRRVENREHFRFAVKLHRSFTHDAPRIAASVLAQFEDFLQPLRESGRLGPILAQFPWSFRRSAENQEYLLVLSESLKPLLVAIELRHGSWSDEHGRVQLGDPRLSVVSVDQPVIGDSIPPVLQDSSGFCYLRLHGRNRENWFRSQADRNQRYDYRYTLAELRPWIDALRRRPAGTRESYIITNNHFQGQAVVNALQIRALLGEDVPEFPAWLEEEFPEIRRDMQEAGARDPHPVSLERESSPSNPSRSDPSQGDLFGDNAC